MSHSPYRSPDPPAAPPRESWARAFTVGLPRLLALVVVSVAVGVPVSALLRWCAAPPPDATPVATRYLRALYPAAPARVACQHQAGTHSACDAVLPGGVRLLLACDPSGCQQIGADRSAAP